MTVRRRTLIQGLVAGGAAVGGLASAAPARAAGAAAATPWDDWGAFDRSVRSAFDRLRMTGTAIAVVSADRVLHILTLGSRSLVPRRPVTNSTRFIVASAAKSMSSLLVATYVDEGKLSWDQPAVDVWSGFRAPTDALTRTLRVRDLLGMGSGLGEAPYVSTFQQGYPTTEQLVQSVVNLPVVASRVDQTYFYANTVYATGAYLPFLAAGVHPLDLRDAWDDAVRARLYGPAGMTGAVAVDDPRGVTDDNATGYAIDLRLRPSAQAYPPVGAFAPVGRTAASIDDMAAYVRLQLRGGVSVTGRRVVSEANLAQCHVPHVDVPRSPDLDPDAVSQGYAMGWITERYRDGTTLTWHNGGLDGFTSYMGFLPGQDLGLVVLSNTNVTPAAATFYVYVLNLLLEGRLGLNRGVTDRALAAGSAALTAQQQLQDRSSPVDLRATEPWLGFYEGGYSLVRDGRDLVVHNGPRQLPLRALADGSYVVADGLLVTLPVRLARDGDGTPFFELVGIEKVRRNTGLPG